ncbi:MAG: DUF1223 domain-containing protein [Hyphomicrobium sp.]
MNLHLRCPVIDTLAAVLAVTAASIFPAAAQNAPTDPAASAARPISAIIELFTSQGCSSCPPADALLKTYAQTGGVLALSLPVDYWDYIGWKDTLASPKNTERQRAYVKTFGRGPLYTPQAVINGVTDVIGSDQAAVDRAIMKSSKLLEDRRVAVSFRRQSSSVIVETGAPAAGSEVKEATIWLVVMRKSAEVAIKRGENSGKTISYSNVVRDMTPIGVWNGKPGVVQLTLAAVMDPETEDSAVILQEGATGTGAIVGAAWLNR